ncbi:sulfoxide reductase heme-binding subunit YedZ [Sinobacterium caligoides]|uniref:Protein-methionine-sulfoxide reductase heme-binding subunit MsrQ n=1 Tax=Sinobacterium caligoides TaxID=933926 RepID=A0A3N2DFP8_9GAMM|nr:ferric reductase-like transmembrane domain-containing protein [Sinobacterium caligoides]ROR98616.1 sulfoxide reductase heme-binding subunit YedZ [Sinobacterium caligoides]
MPYYKLILPALMLLPFVKLLEGVLANDLGPDPVAMVADYTGLWALITLLITLSLSPLSRLIRRRWLLRARRQAGLVVFFYASLHLLTFLALQAGWQWQEIVKALSHQPYIILGMLGYVVLLPLAITSTNRWVRRLGSRWKQLHRLVYVALFVVCVHGWWQLRADGGELLPYIIWAAVIALDRLAYAYIWLPRRSYLSR